MFLFSGPSKTKARVERLYNKEGEKFDEAWLNELEKLNRKLTTDFEDQLDNSDESLKQVVTSSLATLRIHQELLTEAESEKEER